MTAMKERLTEMARWKNDLGGTAEVARRKRVDHLISTNHEEFRCTGSRSGPGNGGTVGKVRVSIHQLPRTMTMEGRKCASPCAFTSIW
jgi:hypothetical protein